MTSATLELRQDPGTEPLARTMLVSLRKAVDEARWHNGRDRTIAILLVSQALSDVLTVWRCKACDAGPFRGRPDSCDACGGELRRGFLCERCGYHEVRTLETVCDSCKETAGA